MFFSILFWSTLGLEDETSHTPTLDHLSQASRGLNHIIYRWKFDIHKWFYWLIRFISRVGVGSVFFFLGSLCSSYTVYFGAPLFGLFQCYIHLLIKKELLWCLRLEGKIVIGLMGWSKHTRFRISKCRVDTNKLPLGFKGICTEKLHSDVKPLLLAFLHLVLNI